MFASRLRAPNSGSATGVETLIGSRSTSGAGGVARLQQYQGITSSRGSIEATVSSTLPLSTRHPRRQRSANLLGGV